MGGKTTTTKNTFDPVMQGLVKDNVTRAQGVADNISQPYTGQLSAGTSPEMKSYFDAAQAVQGSGQGLLGSAADVVHKALGYTPMQVTAPTMTSANAGQAHTVDANGILGNLSTATAGNVNRGDIRNVGVGAFDANALQPYLNPATSQIVDATLADNEHARQQAANFDNAKAGAAHAFGNSGFGVAKAGTNDAFQRSAGTLAANVRGKAFDSASNLLMQHLGLDLQGQQANQGADMGVASKNADIGMFNSGQKNAANQLGTQLGAQLGMYNAGAQNDFAQNQATRDQQTGAINQADQLQALLANQTAGLQGNQQQLTGAGLLGDLSNATVNQGLAQTQLLGQAGTAQQGLAQDALTRQYQAWLQNYQNQLAGQGVVNNAAGLIPGISDRTGTQTESGGNLGSILGGAGTLLQGAAMFSDLRLKEDVQTVGYDAKGRRWVDYRYLWDDPGVTHRGVIAQEVAHTDPHAVGMHPSGFLMVDYSKLED